MTDWGTLVAGREGRRQTEGGRKGVWSGRRRIWRPVMLKKGPAGRFQ